MMHRLRLSAAAAALALGLAPAAQAGMYVTGSYSLQSTNLPFQLTEQQAGSLSADIDLGRYVRLGYTYGQELQKTIGYKDPNAANSVDTTLASYCSVTCGQTYNKTKIIQNSIGLTIILYEGETLMPFALAGAVRKDATIETQDYDSKGNLVHTVSQPAGKTVPYGGGGVGVRLNRSFTLKFSYQVSPAIKIMPGTQLQATWDRQASAGLTYQL